VALQCVYLVMFTEKEYSVAHLDSGTLHIIIGNREKYRLLVQMYALKGRYSDVFYYVITLRICDAHV